MQKIQQVSEIVIIVAADIVLAVWLLLQCVGSFFTEKSLLHAALSWSARQATLLQVGDEECDNKEVEDKRGLVFAHPYTHTQMQQCAVVMVPTVLAPPYCKQRGGDRLPELVNIISVIQQT